MATASRYKLWADRLAVESEPELTTTQLMVRRDESLVYLPPLVLSQPLDTEGIFTVSV